MKLKKISALLLCLGMVCAGCSANGKEEKVQKELTNHVIDSEKNTETGQTDIQETIMEHLTENRNSRSAPYFLYYRNKKI